MKAADLAQRLAEDTESICRLLLPNGKRQGQEWCVGSVQGEAGESLKVHLTGTKAGMWRDFAADHGGDLLDLLAAVRGLSIGDAIRDAKVHLGIREPRFEGHRQPSFTRPQKPKCNKPTGPVLEWLMDERNLSLEAINTYRLAEMGREVVFPYLRNEALIAVKYRNIDDKKKMRVEKDCEPLLFGWQAIPPTARDVVICEGELDAVSWYQLGHPALSVPNGANGHTWIEYEFEYLERFDTIYISFDNDEPGRKGAAEVIDRLGRERCRVIEIPVPWKDANDLVKSHFDAFKIKPLFDKARTLDPEELKPASDFVDEVIQEFYPPDDANTGFNLPWDKTHGLIRLRPGEVSLLGGVNGHGKSEGAGHLTLDALWQGEKACIASMEFKPRRWLMRLTRQASGFPEPSIQFIRKIHTWYQNKLWVFDAVGHAKADRVLEVFSYARRRYGIRLFVIDNLAKCGFAEDDYNGQKAFVDQLTDFAKEHESHVILVAHMRKGHDENRPAGKMDVKGTGAITDMVDTVLIWWRNKPKEEERRKAEHANAPFDESGKPDAMVICEKQRNGDDEPRITLWFDQESHQFLCSAKNRPKQYVEFTAQAVEHHGNVTTGDTHHG
ncbi:MAG TPA: bifunctional DNA primase/helicase [Gammaproteobacteria bacterium]|nr:bifunctional DNA primase/helicase [Gammaproteobacteria bacterium]